MIQPVSVLGQGQLGRMLRAAGERLGVAVSLLDPEAPTRPDAGALVTVESEHWPDNAGIRALMKHPGWQNARTLACLPDRRCQKQLLDDLQLPHAPWCIPDDTSSVASLRQKLGPAFLLKSARGGYDGRGQYRVSATADDSLPDWKTQAIAEAAIDFETEISLVGARRRDGRCVFYRLAENHHRSGTLAVSLSQPGRFAAWQPTAEAMLSRLLDHLDYVGVMAMECFVVGDDLLINELAPRVHNSGHWTQAGASICQFELHLRALLDLPLPTPEQAGTTAMINLLGLEYDPQWLAVPGTRLHWYGKTFRSGRKMGHINLHHRDPETVAQWLRELPLPEEYRTSRDWALAQLETKL